MKKYILPLVLTVLMTVSVNGQVSITANDLSASLQVGKQITVFSDQVTASINIGSTGNFGTIDFSSLKKSATYITTSMAPNTSPYVADFSGAQFASKNNQQYGGSAAENWVYTAVSDAYYLNGIGTATTTGGFSATVKLKYNPTKIVYKLPITLNGTNSLTTTQSIATTLLGFTTTVNNTEAYSYNVDGYGTMKTPEGKTLDCLRIRTETSITANGNISKSVSFIFLTKTGEAVTVVAKDGNPAGSGVIQVSSASWQDGDGTSNPTAVKAGEIIPQEFSLAQNYPNPFNPSTRINFSVPTASAVTLKIYDMLGREIAQLVNNNLSAGNYSTDFNAANLTSGIYFYTLQTDKFSETKKMILVK